MKQRIKSLKLTRDKANSIPIIDNNNDIGEKLNENNFVLEMTAK